MYLLRVLQTNFILHTSTETIDLQNILVEISMYIIFQFHLNNNILDLFNIMNSCKWKPN